MEALFKVELIDFTGCGHFDPNYAAKKLIIAKSTRLGKDVDVKKMVDEMSAVERNKELEYIANTIRSSWEFINYTFRISGVSRACCDQMTRSRVGVSFAVQAQRVADKSEFDYVTPTTIKNNPDLNRRFQEAMRQDRETYQFFISQGVPAQDARSVMPMACESPLTAEYNLRALADIIAKRKNLRAQGEYASVAVAMERLVLNVHPWAKAFLDPDRTATPALDKILKDLLGTSGPLDKPALNEALKEVDKLKGVWG